MGSAVIRFSNILEIQNISKVEAISTFEVTTFVSSRHKSNNPSVMGRLINNLIFAINQHKQLPKCIVIILDDDIVKYIHSSKCMPVQIATITGWISKEMCKVIQTYREFLPAKCKRDFQLHLLWICPPTHKYFGTSSNMKREEMATCLEAIAKMEEGMSALRLIKSWNPQDSRFFLKDSYRFTCEGLNKYWAGVDAAIRFWNIAIYPKLLASRMKGNNTHFKKKRQFAWKKEKF